MESAQIIACSKVISLHLLQSRQPTSLYSPHKGVVNCIHINHTNKVIASCGQDGRIVLVNAQKPDNQVFETNFHSGTSIKPPSVNTIMFSSHSHYIAAGSSDSLIKIWDMKNHKQVYSTIKSHVGSVTSLAWIKNSIEKTQGQILASSSTAGDIFLHSVKSSNIVQTLNTKNQQAVNQIKVSESQGHCRLAACTSNGSVMVWNIRNLQKDINPFCYFNNGKKSSITSLSFSSFNPVLLATSSVDENLTFYDVNQKKSVKVIIAEQPLTSINFHSDGHTLVAGGMYGGLFVYDLRKPSKPKQKLSGHDSAIKHTVFIKQYEPSSSNMGASRSSKTSSVASYNSSKIPSSKSVKQIDEPMQQVRQNNYMENVIQNVQSLKKQQPFRSQSIKNSNEHTTDNGRQNIKLSTTGREAIKNSELKNPSLNKNLHPDSLPSKSSGYNYYNKPSRTQVSLTGNIAQMGTAQTSTIPNQSTIIGSPPQANTLLPSSLSADLKDFIEQKFDTLHMQLIRQFHMQQLEMKEMITSLLTEDKKKNQKIKDLQNQIKSLKNNTY